jgi:O-antigen/teichoic acid export membrane protein
MIRHLSERVSVNLAQISSKAKSDFVYTGGAQGVGLVTSFFTALVITDRLGLNQLGAYALIISISTFLAALAEVGIGQTAIRYASLAHANSDQKKCNEVVAWSINIRILFALVSVAAGVYLSEWLGTHVWSGGTSSEFIPYAFVLGAVTILQQCVNAYFHTHHYFRFLSLVTLLHSSLILAGTLMLSWLDLLSLESIVFLTIAVALITFFINVIRIPWRSIYVLDGVQECWKFRFKIQGSRTASGLLDDTYGIKPKNFAANLLASSLIVTLFTRLDIWMIGALLSETEVGVYKLASYFATPLALVVGAFNTTLWPRASKLISQTAISAFILKTIQISFLLMLLMLFYIFSLIWLPGLLFPNYASAITGLAIALSIRYLFSMLITPASVVGYNLGMSQVYVIVNVIQLAAVFAFNSTMISVMGLYAPAIALIVADLIGVLVIWPLLRKRIHSLIAV